MWLTVQLRIAIYKISYRDDDRLFVLVLSNTGKNSKKVETESKIQITACLCCTLYIRIKKRAWSIRNEHNSKVSIKIGELAKFID